MPSHGLKIKPEGGSLLPMTRTPLDPTSLRGRPCSVAAALSVVGDRWSLLIVRELLFGNGRFSEIARNTGAPRDRLSARLVDLVDSGIVSRSERGYALTAAGTDLAGVLAAMRAWADRWVVSAPTLAVSHHGHPIDPVVQCRTCGGPVDSPDVVRQMLVPGWTGQGPIR